MLKAANRLQNVYRGKLARQRAEDLAKKEAFYAARDIVIEEMKDKVAAEFKKKEVGNHFFFLTQLNSTQRNETKLKFSPSVRLSVRPFPQTCPMMFTQCSHSLPL